MQWGERTEEKDAAVPTAAGLCISPGVGQVPFALGLR